MGFGSRAHRPAIAGVIALSAVCLTSGQAASETRKPPRPSPPSESAAAAAPAATAHQKEAQQHFERASLLYKQGSYREAIAELERALGLDSGAKDLVFNLGVVHEKLGNIDDAIGYFKRYSEMDLTPQERSRSESYLKRLDGAKKELEDKERAKERERAAAAAAAAQATPGQPAKQPPERPAPVPPPPNGRVDALTIGAATLAVGGIAMGAVFAVKASSDRPPASGFVTGRDGTYAELEGRANDAHRSAVLADIGFGVGVAAGIGAALLYFLRPKATSPKSGTSPAPVSAAPITGGGAVILRGTF